MAEIITMKQGESKTFRFLLTRGSIAVDLTNYSGYELKFAVKKKAESTSYLFSKTKSDFDVTDEASGIVLLTIKATDIVTMVARTYMSELKTKLSIDDIDKSVTIPFVLGQSVIHD